MQQQFSQQQQALIDENKRITDLPKSSRSINDTVIGDLITDGYRFYTVVELSSYNGYQNALMTLFCLERCPNTGIWGYLEYRTKHNSYKILSTRGDNQCKQ